LLSIIYQSKHSSNLDIAKVTFSFDPTTQFRLPTYLT